MARPSNRRPGYSRRAQYGLFFGYVAAVSGAAIAIGRRALLNRDWAGATTARLVRDCVRLDTAAASRRWQVIGGTPLFRLYEVGDALAVQEMLARVQIWSRVFVQQPGWLRLGLPGDESEWERLATALAR